MKNESYSFAQLSGKLGVSTEEAGNMVGSDAIFREMVSAKWLKPVVDRHRLRLFDRADVVACWGRLKDGEALEAKAPAKA